MLSVQSFLLVGLSVIYKDLHGQHDIDVNIDAPVISAFRADKKDHLVVKQPLYVQPVQRFV